jgi:hypothetical protein
MREKGPDKISFDPGAYLERRTLILGDVNTGKTALTSRIMEAMCEAGLGERIMALDLAPEIPPDVMLEKDLAGVGGFLRVPEARGFLYLRPRILPPRLMAKRPEEAISIAQENLRAIEGILERPPEARDILFVNDMSLYLHAGDANQLICFLRKFPTVVANAYRGRKLPQGPISSREREQVDILVQFFDLVLEL